MVLGRIARALRTNDIENSLREKQVSRGVFCLERRYHGKEDNRDRLAYWRRRE